MIRYIFIITISLLSYSFISHGQENKIDSLKSLIITLDEDTNKVNALNELSYNLWDVNPDEAIIFSKEALYLSGQIEYLKGEAYALKNMGLAYYGKGNYLEVIEYWEKSLAIFRAINYKVGISNIINNLGMIYSYQGRNSEALAYFEESLEIAEEIQDTVRIISASLNMAVIFFEDTAMTDATINLYYKVLMLSNLINYQEALGTVSVNLGDLYSEDNNYDSAISYYNKALNYFDSQRDKSFVNSHLGKLYKNNGEYKKAIEHHQKAYDQANDGDFKYEKTLALIGLAETFQEEKNYNRAIYYYDKAKEIATKLNLNLELKTIYSGLLSIYEDKSDFINAYNYQSLLSSIKDSIYNDEIATKIMNLQFLTKSKNRTDSTFYANKINQLQAKAEREKQIRLLYLFISGGVVIIFIFVISIIFKYRNQKRKLLLQNEDLENERKYTKRLKTLDKLKDQFLGNTSHELRTPLNGIIGLADSLQEGSAGDLPQEAKHDLKMISTSGKRLSNLVNDILDFEKIKKKDLELQLSSLDLRTVSNIVIALCQTMAKEKNLDLINEIPEDLPYVNADENRVQQILYNLIGNAIKFTESGDIKITAERKDGKVVTNVIDTGIGIEEKNLEKIFESFEQADGSTAREYGGTGLGLSITKKLVELHGGDIWVNTEIGIGSTFSFSFPIFQGEVEDEETKDILKEKIITSEEEYNESVEIAVDKNKQRSNGVEVLVVDDEHVNRKVLNNYLSMDGYNVTEASSGLEALELIKQNKKFDLIILDIMMPKMSGYEVCEKLRDLFLPSQLPIVMLTAKNRINDLVEGFSIGANDYLVKPFSKDELLSRIKTHLNLYGINKATGKFVPHEFLKAIGRTSITDVRLGDFSEKEVTVFFSDIRDYTNLSEKMTPEQNFNFINAYVGRMGPIINRYEGFVNQYLGDAIVAMFPKKADNSLSAAIDMQKAIQEYNKKRISDKKLPIAVGMGLHTGPLVMGIIGDENRNDTATIADTVNAASRMEGMTKYYGANIIVSEATLELIENKTGYNVRYLGKVQLKGKDKAIGVYECFDGDEEKVHILKKNTSEIFEDGINRFLNKDFAESSAIFDRIVKSNPDDKVAMHFRQRAAHYMIEGVEESWTGIERLERK